MNLYDIDHAILDCVDEETGEILDFDRLNELQMEREQKIENVACWAKNTQEYIESIKREKKRLDECKTKAEKQLERQKVWLRDALSGQKMTTAKVVVSFRKSESVNVLDEKKIPAAYMAEKISVAPDKTAIKEALKSGLKVPGAELESKLNTTIK